MNQARLQEKCFFGCSLNDIHTIIFDFDGIFTDNKVYSDSSGNEFVCCSKSDSYGLNILNKFIKYTSWELNLFILSTEKNQVVKKRADKLGLDCYQGVENKFEFIKNKFSSDHDMKFLDGIIYLGNDLNDYQCIKNIKYSYVPADSHKLILDTASIVSNYNGGNGFIRDFLEKLLDLDINTFKKISNI